MSRPKGKAPIKQPDALFDRIVTILEEARGRVVRAVNTGMVTAYWLIGREIVEELQGGEERAEYGRQVIASLSARLTERYGKGFSERNLLVFRQFYLVFRDRITIPHPPGAESSSGRKLHLLGGDFGFVEDLPSTEGVADPAVISSLGETELTPPQQIRYRRVANSRKPSLVICSGRTTER